MTCGQCNVLRPRANLGTPQHRTHGQIRSAACENAKRKARALFRHRSTIVRWTRAEETIDHRSPLQTEPSPDSGYADAADGIGKLREPCSARNADFIREDLLSLVTAHQLGRHFVAAAAISTGTVLIRERPFAWCLENWFAGKYCAQCLSEVGCVVAELFSFIVTRKALRN